MRRGPDGSRFIYFQGMETQTISHPGYRGVCRAMRYLVDRYYADVRDLARLSMDDFFDYVAAIPYVMDSDMWGEGRELIARPARFGELTGLDCKKKAILVGCWARCRGIGYRFVVVDDTGAGFSHVFAEVEESPGFWVTMDCTLPNLFRPGSPMPNVRVAEVL